MHMKKEEVEKLHEIGARLVETCLTCVHSNAHGNLNKSTRDRHCTRHNIVLPNIAVCNDYSDGANLTSARERRRQPPTAIRKVLPLVATEETFWAACTNCAWQGWSCDRNDRYHSDHDTLPLRDRCPNCGEYAGDWYDMNK